MSERAPDLSGKDVADLNLAGTRVRGVIMPNAKITDAFMLNAEIDGMFAGLKINGIEVAPLIAAEIDKRHPLVPQIRNAATVAALRAACDDVCAIWDDLIARAGALDEATLQARVDDEWSFCETLRHLIYVIDIWASRAIADDPGPVHPWGAPPPFFGAVAGIDLDAKPTFAEVVALRAERVARLRAVIDGLTDADLDVARTPSTEGHPPGAHKPGDALRTVISEEYWHSTYAARDLDTLTAT